MDIENKKYLYSNGSSITCGGGFELDSEFRVMYKTKGIEIPDTQTECSYPFLLSQKLGFKFIDESTYEGNSNTIIETTKKWIQNNSDKISETIFILELKSISDNDGGKLVEFISYLNDNKIEYIISIPSIDDTITQKKILNKIPTKSNIFPMLNHKGIFQYCLSMGLLLKDEIPCEDFNLSWAGNNNIANLIYKFIKEPKKGLL